MVWISAVPNTCCKFFSSVYPKKPSLDSGISSPPDADDPGVEVRAIDLSSFKADMVGFEKTSNHQSESFGQLTQCQAVWLCTPQAVRIDTFKIRVHNVSV